MRTLTSLFTAIILLTGMNVMAQNTAKLTVKGDLICDRKANVMSTVTIYRYYQLSQSTELMEQQMIHSNGSFKFNLEFDKEYVIDVASSTGAHKRINLNTEVMKGYKYENQKFDFEVDVTVGDIDKPEEAAWIYFDPSANQFSHATQMPMALQAK